MMNICPVKEIIKKMKRLRENIIREKYLQVSDEGLVSRIHKELLEVNKKTTQFKKG